MNLKDIAGLTYAKSVIQEAFFLPIQFPGIFNEGKPKPWTKILLYGVVAKSTAIENLHYVL